MHLEVNNVSFKYKSDPRWILKDVNFSVSSTERVAVVGDSGCGKSTLSQVLAGYYEPDSGEVLLDGKPLPEKGYSPVQLIYQHPEQAVNPRWKMKKILDEGSASDEKILNILGIEKDLLERWPNELSGGELQRFCIARVLNNKSKFLICDEISTMLDAITQAQIWELILREIKKNETGLIVVTHNMALAEKVCDKIIYLPSINSASSSSI